MSVKSPKYLLKNRLVPKSRLMFTEVKADAQQPSGPDIHNIHRCHPLTLAAASIKRIGDTCPGYPGSFRAQ
jgi:hypothetical protein